MLQVQQQLIDELKSQLSSNPPPPEQLSTWAEHPVTQHFLNQFRLNALDQDIDPWSPTLETDAKMFAGYIKAVNDMEELAEEFRTGVSDEA